MHFQAPIIASLALTAFANPIALEERAPHCTDGVVVFAVRGSDPMQETLGPNPRFDQLPAGMTNTANAAIKQAGGGHLRPIQYPAVNPDSGLYSQSVAMGISALSSQISQYAKACNNGKIVVIGYSQGAQVTSQTLGSTNPASADNRVAAAILFADPTYTDGVEPLDAGDGDNDGSNGSISDPATQNRLNQRFGKQARSFCQKGDDFCDNGGNPGLQIHLDSPQHFQTPAINFLKTLNL